MEKDIMHQYKKLINDIIANGENVSDRTGVGTRSIFGYQMKFDLGEGFPAVTIKKLAWKAVVGELLWFLEGGTDERRLAELTFGKDREDLVKKKTIWTANADKQGVELGHYNDEYIKDLGPVYGSQWRKFSYYQDDPRGVDQVLSVIKQIKQTPDSRRIIMSAWNPMVLNTMALPPCHVMAQFVVRNGKLHCQMYQRSADVGLGVPFNIASYALLTHIIARECKLDVGTYVHTIGDAHIYNDHSYSLVEVLEREPYPLPTLEIDESFDLIERLSVGFKKEDSSLFKLINYNHHSEIKMNMAV
jgi:thymidylate synthase